jgi:hypothetical protein
MVMTVFYSWQSDTPNSTNRTFIENCLKKAIHEVRDDLSVQEALRDEELSVDKDTAGIPGMPEIANTIFEKIERCAVFVPDLTFIAESQNGRFIPNPNVLIEYGWALAKLSRARFIPVMNVAFGSPASIRYAPPAPTHPIRSTDGQFR